MRFDIDTPYVEEQLTETLHRPAVVVSLCWGWHGLDDLYFLTEDLLKRRKVKMIVFYDDCGVDAPHKEAWRWFRMGDNERTIEGLSIRERIYYYYGAVIGMPRNLVNLLRPNLAPDLSPGKLSQLEHLNHDISAMKRLGSDAAEWGFGWESDTFAEYEPKTDASSSDVVLYSPGTRTKFDFSGPAPPALQVYFARKLVSLAKLHGTPLVLLLLPTVPKTRDTVIRESPLWPAALDGFGTICGTSPARLFSGLSDDQILRLFADPGHFNQNGQRYYTRIITPTLIKLYETSIKH